MLSIIARIRDARRQVEADASAAMEEHGALAYAKARDQAREARQAGDHGAFVHWSRVAVRIAKLTGYVIGEKAADRYEADRRKRRRTFRWGSRSHP